MSPPNSALLCFEDKKDAILYAGWFPEDAERLFSFEALIDLLAENKPLDAATRAREAEKLFPDETQEYRKQLLTTIEYLRTAWLMTAQDVDYAFSNLPATPKNQKLRIEFQRYLESPLKQDVVQSLFEARERLKQPGMAWDRQLNFYKSEATSPLFEEIGKSFPDPAEVGDIASSGAARALALHGNSAEALHRLVQNIKSHTGSSIVAFGGSRSELVLLKCLLKAEGLTFQDDFSDSLTKELADPLSVLRSGTASEKEKRDWEKKAFFRRSEQRAKRLSTDEYLRLVVPEVSTHYRIKRELVPEQMAQARVQIVPFRRYAVPPEKRLLGFAGNNFLELKLPEYLLTAEEMETLRGKGLPLASPFDQIARREATLDWYAKGYHDDRFLFSSLPADAFEATRLFTLAGKKRLRRPAETVALSLPAKPFSATGLENLAQCPMKFLFAQKLRLRQTSEENQDQAPIYYGQLVHKALETVFQEPGIEKRDSPEILTVHFERAIDTLFPHLKPKTAFSTLLREQFTRTSQQVAPLERALALIRGKGHPINFEKQFSVDWNGHELKGVIDRIDETENGDLLVIDYKTGTVDFSPTHIPSGANFQALIYLLAVEKLFGKRCLGVLFYDLKKYEIRRGLMRAESLTTEAKKALTRGHALDSEKFQLITESGIAEMERLMKLSDEGRFEPSPSGENCSMCDYQVLCRRAHGYV